MAGGKWNPTDLPVLPGMFLNFQAAAGAAIQTGSRGTVVVPVKAHWGPIRSFYELGSESDITDIYTADESSGATAYTTARLALLGGAQKVMGYRLASSAAAKAFVTLKDGATVNVLTVTGKYEGARGNSFKLVVQTNAVDGTKQDVKLYEGTTLLRTWTVPSGVQGMVDTINNDTANAWVTATFVAAGSGVLALTAGAQMSGGDSGIAGVVAADYTAATTAFETLLLANVVALDGISDSAIQATVASWIKRVRDEGFGIIGVFGGSSVDDTASDAVARANTRSAGFGHEGIVNVGTGAISGAVIYSSAQVAAWVAGLIAGTALNGSTTYAVAPFDDVTRRWIKSEKELAVKSGTFVLYHDGRKVKVLRGVNTLTAPSVKQNNQWKKIRTIRTIDAINSDLMQTAEDTYVGKVNNTEEGRLTLIAAGKQYLGVLATAGIIETTGYNVYLHPDYYGPTAKLTPAADQVFLMWDAIVSDSMEQIFGTFNVH